MVVPNNPVSQASSSPFLPPPSAGMAGSGKTTFLQRLNSHFHENQIPGYIINLDPAVTKLPYGANIDIRDTARISQLPVNFIFLSQSSSFPFNHALELENGAPRR